MFKFARAALPLFITVSIFSPKISFSQAPPIPPVNIVRSNASCQGVGRPVTKLRLQQIANTILARGGQLLIPGGTVEDAFEVFSVDSVGASPYNQGVLPLSW